MLASSLLRRRLLPGLLAAGLATASQAALLLTDGSGRLLGASGVVVAGTAYDVQFRDGSCAALFNGCDTADDFLFNTQAKAAAASTALRDQVFEAFSTYDLAPELTRGCEAAAFYSAYWGQTMATCWVLTPIYTTADAMVGAMQVVNDRRDFMDLVNSGGNLVLGRHQDISSQVRNSYVDWYTTWAVWQQAGAAPATQALPEPGSLALAATALALLLRRRRRA
ncbi:MAG: hypothetical protein ACK44A_03465 [Roseateles sp.]